MGALACSSVPGVAGILFLFLFTYLFIFTANVFVLGGSGTTVTHNTQNNTHHTK
jgi:hypothetical protein